MKSRCICYVRLLYCFEQDMHPYEMAFSMRCRSKSFLPDT